MTLYRIQFTARAERQLAQLPTSVQTKLVARAEQLASDARPTGSKKLRGLEPRWRIRVGDYRIVYEIRDEVLIILVVALGHRREVYRRMP